MRHKDFSTKVQEKDMEDRGLTRGACDDDRDIVVAIDRLADDGCPNTDTGDE